ncbi:hypothetical protein [Tenacibaculum sp. 190524A02b]|uniref:hypothetical protein n=1 Tax=Tenacibaculum vairaonense TaxID=3137860 RepID=UPI0031FB8209
MSKKPIKSNLFRFITLRGPQTIEDKEKGFIEFPASKKTESIAFKAIKNITKEEERKSALKSAFNSRFIPISKKEEVKGLHAGLYKFSNWLIRHKNNLSYTSIRSNLNNAQILTLDEELLIWDNLFYQTINKASVSIREYLIQLLVANQFLKAFKTFETSLPSKSVREIVFTNEDEKSFVRRANASVVIPKEVVFSSKEQTLNQQQTLSTSLTNYMKADLKVEQAKKRALQYKQVLSEVEKQENVYRKKEELRYKTALDTYNTEVTALKDAAKPSLKKYMDFESGVEKTFEVYPDLDLPEFKFTEAIEINREPVVKDSNSQFSEETLNFLNASDIKDIDTFSGVKKVLTDKIKEQYQTIFNSTPERVKTVNVLGESVDIDIEKQKPLYSYTGYLDSNQKRESSIIILLKVEDASKISIDSCSYEITNSSGKSLHTNTLVETKRGKSDSILEIRLFPDSGNFINQGSYFISGQFVLSNGLTINFGPDDFNILIKDGYLESEGIFGQCKENESDKIDLGGDGILYGVSNLGIADFRRVEQELCCYVPGEVSHIENIMAREYKERSTKNLTSFENSTERSSEKETENLTDTSSTERNEMQTEASSIVNKDTATNFGANASVHGGIGTQFNFGSNFNTSNNSSSSDSNLQAKTYAQDVTERALEKVIQKTSVKRTSRMLQEFEENNSHGFDNRKGDKHINGVYRWVDKIYKNKMVNYGKRLMYEFALPEPAKFLVNLQSNSNKGSFIKEPVKPIHPKDIEGAPIRVPSDITESNYQGLEGKYNIDIDTPLDSQIKITDIVSGAFGKGGHAASYSLNIPENYEAFYYKAAISATHAHGVEPWRMSLLSFNVGGKITGTNNWSPKGELSNITEKVSYSINAWDMGRYNISLEINCKLSDRSINEWKSKAYKKLMDSYNSMLQDYNIELKEYEDKLKLQKEERKQEQNEQKGVFSNKSTLINRSIEKRELKRIAIDLMTKPFDINTADSHYVNQDYKTINRDQSLQKHIEVVKFFEQAFDWEIMAYTFYPYFYGAKKDWGTSVSIEGGNDPIFKAFLQSAMARAIVPIRPGFEDAINWYMKTGEIWNGKGMVTDMDNELYLSIAEELQTVQGEVEGTWETRVPTSLTVLQADSVALNEGGLPCNPNCEGNGLFDTVKTSPDGVDYDIVGATNTVA